MEIFENPMFGHFSWKRNDVHDNITRQAYRSVLLIGSDASIYDVPSFASAEKWRRISKTKFNISYTEVSR